MAFLNCSEGYHSFFLSLRMPPEATSFFHCPSFSLLFFTNRQASPEPSQIPLPVNATFSRSFPLIGDMQRQVSNPSKLVSTTGYKSLFVEKIISAPGSVYN